MIKFVDKEGKVVFVQQDDDQEPKTVVLNDSPEKSQENEGEVS
jgi:hypothetical protein